MFRFFVLAASDLLLVLEFSVYGLSLLLLLLLFPASPVVLSMAISLPRHVSHAGGCLMPPGPRLDVACLETSGCWVSRIFAENGFSHDGMNAAGPASRTTAINCKMPEISQNQ